MLAGLVVSPSNHLNVYVYTHFTVLHEDDSYLDPLFQILRAWKNAQSIPTLREMFESSRTKSHISDDSDLLLPLQSYTSLSALSDERGLLVGNALRAGEWWDMFFSPRPGAGLRQQAVVMMCFLIVVIVVPSTDALSAFFQDTVSLQRDLVYILQHLHVLREDKDLLAIGYLGLDCLEHLAFRSEQLSSDEEDSDNCNRFCKARCIH